MFSSFFVFHFLKSTSFMFCSRFKFLFHVCSRFKLNHFQVASFNYSNLQNQVYNLCLESIWANNTSLCYGKITLPYFHMKIRKKMICTNLWFIWKCLCTRYNRNNIIKKFRQKDFWKLFWRQGSLRTCSGYYILSTNKETFLK